MRLRAMDTAVTSAGSVIKARESLTSTNLSSSPRVSSSSEGFSGGALVPLLTCIVRASVMVSVPLIFSGA